MMKIGEPPPIWEYNLADFEALILEMTLAKNDCPFLPKGNFIRSGSLKRLKKNGRISCWLSGPPKLTNTTAVFIYYSFSV